MPGPARGLDEPRSDDVTVPAFSWLERRGLRWRLVALLVVLLLAGCLGVGVVTTVALHRFLVQRLDQQLAAAGDRYSVGLEHPGDSDGDERLFSSAVGQPIGTLGARVLAGRVTAIGVVTGGGARVVPSDEDRALLATLKPSARPRTLKLASLGEYRVLATAGRDGDVQITGLPERGIDDTIARLMAIEGAVFAVVLVLMALSSAVGVRLALRPLNRVATTARRVAGLPMASGAVTLTERVPAGAPSTEVGRLAEAFNLMLHHVEESLTQRQAGEDRLRTFVADASHELRTPVTVIRSHTEFIQRLPVDLPEEVEDALRRVAAEADRTGRLVEDLLLLAQLDSGRALLETDVDLTRLVMDAVGDAHRVDPDRRWQLDLTEIPVVVRGDEHRLHQAVANLLANVSAHTPPGTTVTARVRADPTSEAAVVVVHDDGPGVPAALVPHVFDRFVHDDAAATTAGSGLGLSIVAAIAHAHGGTVDLTSRPGATEFTLTFPLHLESDVSISAIPSTATRRAVSPAAG